MIADIQLPSILKIGGGAITEAASILRRLHCRNPLIVTDPFLMSGPLPASLLAQLQAAGIAGALFHHTVPDPTTAVVETGVEVFRAGRHDSLVSLGGGSPIDTAKAIGMLAANPGRVRDYKVPALIPLPSPPHLAIPTTAGTGSEVSRFTVITDAASGHGPGEKMLLSGSALVPAAAIVDYQLSLTMPPRLTADTGTDSLTHAIESYVSRRANPFSDSMALAAMKSIWINLPIAFREPANHPAREAMMLAATQAGIAFSNASVALVHGMSRPLGSHFHIAHGLSNAMLLPAVTAFSARPSSPGTEANPEAQFVYARAQSRYATCARTMGIASPETEDAPAVEQLIAALYARNAELQVPSPRAYGLDEQKYLGLIPLMAQQALASGSPQNNPRLPTAHEIEALYRQCWQG
jgi:alcohol dehydrogenase class IV